MRETIPLERPGRRRNSFWPHRQRVWTRPAPGRHGPTSRRGYRDRPGRAWRTKASRFAGQGRVWRRRDGARAPTSWKPGTAGQAGRPGRKRWRDSFRRRGRRNRKRTNVQARRS